MIKISKEDVREAMKHMKTGKVVGPDDIPMEVWQCQWPLKNFFFNFFKYNQD